jgi:disintegrin and metalloproteinase domain-containing protein 17
MFSLNFCLKFLSVELGHNWGSEHDPYGSQCSPSSGADGGNYLMYAYSNQGLERNNYKFSSCSIQSISEVLKTKTDCFKSEGSSYCGNDRIEDNEECDAGQNGLQDRDLCCDSNCRLRPGSNCSDHNHECCRNCQIAMKGLLCYSSPSYIDCYEDNSKCTGQSKECPVPSPKKKDTQCHSFDGGKCDSTGHCLSVCSQRDINYESCLCTSNEDDKCKLCCRYIHQKNDEIHSCLPYNQIFMNEFIGDYAWLSNGRACSGGLCKYRKCEVRVNDYVSRFWKVIENVTVNSFFEFMRRNIVASIILISLSFWVPISCCIHFCIDKRNKTAQKNANRTLLQNMKQRLFIPDNQNEGYFEIANDYYSNEDEVIHNSKI